MSRRPDEELPLSRQKPVGEDVRQELETHLRLREDELIAEGWDAAAARAEARRVFGDVSAVAHECRDITVRQRRSARRAETIGALWQDLAFAARVLRKTPGFTLAAIVTLALGIGANTAIFGVVNAVLLRPLPFEHPERLVDVSEAHEQGWSNPPYANVLDWRAAARSFEGMASYTTGTRTVLGASRPVRVINARVALDFFRILGARTAIGRLPAPDEHAVGGAPVAVVSYHFWRNELGADSNLSALRLRIDREYQVVGVLEPDFDYPLDTQVWTALEVTAPTMSRTAHNQSLLARLKPGVSIAAADAELDQLTQRMRPQFLPDFDGTGAIVTSLQESTVGQFQRPLYLLLGAAGLLLLVACTNLASTMLARGTARAQEFAVRTALGAGRLRLVRQLFTESLLLAALGCAAGVGLAIGLLELLTRLAPDRLALRGVQLDGWVLAFAAAVALTTSVLVGLFPALRLSDADTGLTLREGRTVGASRARQRIWSALVVAEVALAVVLVCGAGLLVRSFASVLAVDPGFRPERLLSIATDLPSATYDSDARIADYHTRALAALAALPGVEHVGVTSILPLTRRDNSGSFGIEGTPTPASGYGPGQASYRMVSADYFATLGIPLLRGRTFDARDAWNTAGSVIINQALADRWFKDVDPVGRRIRFESGMDNQGNGWVTIVGVAGNTRHRSLTVPPNPETYVPYLQRPARGSNAVLVLRTTGDPAALAGPARTALLALGSEVVPQFATVEDVVAGSVSERRFIVVILGAFGALALFLAGIGIYGVVSYGVAQRTREIGIRIALGAEPASVRRMVQWGAMRTVLWGLGIGAAGAWLATRAMRTLLYEVGPGDPVAFIGAVALLFAAGWLASWLPARRGTRVDPMIAIRTE